MNIITSAVAIALLVFNVGLSKILKEQLCLKLNKEREFNNLDIDLVVRMLIFLGLVVIEFGIGFKIEEIISGD